MIEQQQEIISLLTTMVTQNATKTAKETSTPVAPSLPAAPPPINNSQQETSSLEELLDLTSDDEFMGSPSWSSMLTSTSHGSQPSHPVPELQLITPVSQPVLQLSAPISLSASQLNSSILQSALQHSTTPVPQSTSLPTTPVVHPPVQFSTQPQPLLTAVSQFSTPLPQLGHFGTVQTSSAMQCSIVPVSQPTFQSTPVAQPPVQFSSPQLIPASQISTPLLQPADLGTEQTQL